MNIEMAEEESKEIRLPINPEDPEGIKRLIEVVKEEGEEAGVAHEVLGKRNFLRGFWAAQEHRSADILHHWFDREVVSEYAGPWGPKYEALEGMRAAVKLGLTHVTEDDVTEINNSYKMKLSFSKEKKVYERVSSKEPRI